MKRFVFFFVFLAILVSLGFVAVGCVGLEDSGCEGKEICTSPHLYIKACSGECVFLVVDPSEGFVETSEEQLPSRHADWYCDDMGGCDSMIPFRAGDVFLTFETWGWYGQHFLVRAGTYYEGEAPTQETVVSSFDPDGAIFVWFSCWN